MKVTQDVEYYKANDGIIDSIVSKVLDDGIGNIYDYANDGVDYDHIRLATLGWVQGVLYVSNAIKRELRKGLEKNGQD